MWKKGVGGKPSATFLRCSLWRAEKKKQARWQTSTTAAATSKLPQPLFRSRASSSSSSSANAKAPLLPRHYSSSKMQQGGGEEEAKGFGHLFTTQAVDYARFRPDYPPQLFRTLFDFMKKEDEAEATPPMGQRGDEAEEKYQRVGALAVDVGCGTGQVAKVLAAHFDRVIGVDPSAKQLQAAEEAENITYLEGLSESLPFIESHTVDLLASAQAAHWFDLPRFYKEAKRVLKPGGTVALWGYSLCSLDNAEADEILRDYHFNVLGPYWEKQRQLVDNKYVHIQLPFAQSQRVEFLMKKEMTFEEFIGYLGTWSALKTMRERNQFAPEQDPLHLLRRRLLDIFSLSSRTGPDMISVTFPAFLLFGKNH
ncbi:Class I SAM-dependent methyltransferase [Balamuthia mandrillaris]